jgi:hypothetical protein
MLRILLLINPLLDRGLKRDNQYSRCYAISGKTNTSFYATVGVFLDYNNGNGVCYVVRADML